jgi:type III restriction enzyme
MLERIHDLTDLIVMNDEAHHVHDEDLAWHKTLMGIHERLPRGLNLWLDFSATPKDQSGTYFPWSICDYPLAQAVEDRIVKAPLIVHRVDQQDPAHVSADTLIEQYGELLQAALQRFKEHRKTYKKLGLNPVLFVMTEKNVYADKIGEWLRTTAGTGMTGDEVLVIHTKGDGDIQERDLEIAREAARDIDLPGNKVKAIVSVMMLREGWDVRSVTIVLGLRPFTAEARILPEQAVGRGLRLMAGVGPDRTQTLEVLGSAKFEEFVRGLETEGVGIKTVTSPKQPVQIYPLRERGEMDIEIPLAGPIYSRNYSRLTQLDPLKLDPLFDREELDEPLRIKLKMEFATTQTEVHQTDIASRSTAPVQEVLASVTNKIRAKAHLDGVFAELYPLVESYVANNCFGKPISLEDSTALSHLRTAHIQEAIADYLAKVIGNFTAESKPVELQSRSLRLSETEPFQWRRDLPAMTSDKTIFNLVATFNPFERRFAEFLDSAGDIVRFAALGTTGQEAGAKFRVEFLKPSGALGLYHPDFVAVQETGDSETHWILETKGRVWEDTEAKDAAITHWCKQVSSVTGTLWCFLRVNQVDFDSLSVDAFGELLAALDKDGGLSLLDSFDKLGSIEAMFESSDWPSVRAFLEANDFLADLLIEAKEEIVTRFGSQANLKLAVETDPESDEPKEELVLIIETALDRERARALLQSVDEWWRTALPAARHRMTVDLEYV